MGTDDRKCQEKSEENPTACNPGLRKMITVLAEVESIINSRPITYVYDDEESISYPLTPSHLIYGRRITTMPNDGHFEVISTHQSLTRRNKYHKNLLQQFPKQWKQDYLLGLRENYMANRSDTTNGPAVGDVVIVKDPSTARCFWKLATIEELITSKDGKIRAATVKRTTSATRKPQLLKRVIQHLIPEIQVSAQEANTLAPDLA